MGAEAPKATPQQSQPCHQQLAAIDLVFENFRFKSVNRKKSKVATAAYNSSVELADCRIVLDLA